MARSVVITGASSGIGLACAVRLTRAGWRVFGGVRTDEAAAVLREHGVEPLALDVTDAAQIAAAAEAVGGELHGLVDNAGIAIAAPLELVPLDELRRQLEVNVVGQVAVLQALLPALRPARGRVVLMGSIGGRSALPFLGPYAASKHALEAFADVLRIELAPWGIAVSIVEPASVKTAIWTKGAAQADVMREGISREADELYAARIERFKAVALKRGPGIARTSSRRPSCTRSQQHDRRRAISSAATRTFVPGSNGCPRAYAIASSRKPSLDRQQSDPPAKRAALGIFARSCA